MNLKEFRETKTCQWLAKNFMWIVLAIVLSYNGYSIIKDPSGTWDTFVVNMQNPWSYVPFAFIVLIPIVYGIFYLYDKVVIEPRRNLILDQWKESIKKSFEETALMQENEVPDDESIAKYYKMYLKKFELDNADQWNTAEPMCWQQWEREAKGDPDSNQFFRVRWSFMIAMTSDAFMFSPEDGSSTMMRYRDYESMIED